MDMNTASLRVDLRALEREMSEIRKRVAELEVYLRPLRPAGAVDPEVNKLAAEYRAAWPEWPDNAAEDMA